MVPEDVKLLPGQLLGIQQTVRDSRPPPLPHRPPLPSFESPAPAEPAESAESTYAHIDEFHLEPTAAEPAVTEKQRAEAEAAASVDSDR